MSAFTLEMKDKKTCEPFSMIVVVEKALGSSCDALEVLIREFRRVEMDHSKFREREEPEISNEEKESSLYRNTIDDLTSVHYEWLEAGRNVLEARLLEKHLLGRRSILQEGE